MKHLWTNSDWNLLANLFLLSNIEVCALNFNCLINFKANGEDFFNSSYLPIFALKNLFAFLYNYFASLTIKGHYCLILSIASYLFPRDIFALAFKFLVNIIINGDLLFISIYLKFWILIYFLALKIKFLIKIIKNGHLLDIF